MFSETVSPCSFVIRQSVWYPPGGPTGITIRPSSASCSSSGGGT